SRKRGHGRLVVQAAAPFPGPGATRRGSSTHTAPRKGCVLKRLALVAAAACSVALAVRADPIWRGDFETGTLSQWDEVEGLSSRLTVVPSPVRQGKYALRVELRNGDYANGGTRNELVRSEPQIEGMDRYYGWSTMFDASYPSSN